MSRITDHDAEYQASPQFDDDAIDALAMTEDRPDWLMEYVRLWYRTTSDKYRMRIEDAIAGERDWQ
jgi:hypothetical protein